MFSLSDFVRQIGLEKIYSITGDSCFNEEGEQMSLAEQAAVITHYLSLKDKPIFAKSYETKAKQLMKEWIKKVISISDINKICQKMGILIRKDVDYRLFGNFSSFCIGFNTLEEAQLFLICFDLLTQELWFDWKFVENWYPSFYSSDLIAENEDYKRENHDEGEFPFNRFDYEILAEALVNYININCEWPTQNYKLAS